MTIFRFTLRRHLRAAIIWGLMIAAVFFAMANGIFPYYRESTDMFRKVLAAFPKGFGAAFGIDIGILFSFGGFYNFIFTYVGLMGACFALWLGISIFSEEKRNKCSEFLYVRPITRGSIFGWKLASGLAGIVVQFVFFIIANILTAFNFINEKDVTVGRLVLASLALLLMEIVFYAVGVLVGTVLRRVRSCGGTATLLTMACFILNAVVNLLDKEILRYLSILKYFEPYEIFSTGHFPVRYMAAGLIVTVVCLAISFRAAGRDVE